MPGSPLKRARAAARSGQVIGADQPLIPGQWCPVTSTWLGPIGPGTILRVAALRAAGSTGRVVADILRIPRQAGEWLISRPDVVAEAHRLDAVRVRAIRLAALDVLHEVMTDRDNSAADRTRAAGTLLQHTPTTPTDEPDAGAEAVEDYLLEEAESGRLEAMLAAARARRDASETTGQETP